MKKMILKWLGLENLILDAEFAKQKHDALYNMVVVLYDENKKLSRKISSMDVGVEVDYNELANAISYADLAYDLDYNELSENLDMSDLSISLDYEALAEHIDYKSLSNGIIDEVDMDDLADTVSEKIADRDGMHQLISEEIENQGGVGINTDAVESMIDTKIQQFADSLEVVVSAELNINK
jgi:uncharacterized protein YajQ (UPF0234 family)